LFNMNILPEQIIQKVKSAGVIGAGGGGFPAYVKLQAKNIDTVIANGSECEPLLSSDCAMMEQKPDWLIAGLQIAMQAVGAKNGVIALKGHYLKAIEAIKKILPKDGSIKLHLLQNYYPAGDEFLLVYEVTRKIIPEGGIPPNVGVIVNNVITLMQVYQAANGKPVTERTVTLTGEFNEPKIITVPIGTLYKDLIKIGGGLKNNENNNIVLLDGGPMMGKIISAWNSGIAKTTSGVVALSKEHFVIKVMERNVAQVIKQSKTACCQCFRCSDLCPRNLIGHELYPHMTMRTIDYNQAEPARYITSAFLCSKCGICELIACDIMRLSPRKILGAYRTELGARGIKNPHVRAKCVPNSQFENRKISIPTIMKKLDLVKYDFNLNFIKGIQVVKKVRIALNKHIGVVAQPQVKLGQKVKTCDIIASTPGDNLGTVYHASIEGRITDISNDFIEISN
jgi:Na+-translocating ferredoxin:NAD+ oxidoreductase RnfC subunit